MRIGNHLGSSFKIWSRQHAWFWFVADASCNEAALGAVAQEAEAICEAYSSIEEMVARRPGTADPQGSIKPSVNRDQKCGPASSGREADMECLQGWTAFIPHLAMNANEQACFAQNVTSERATGGRPPNVEHYGK